MYMSPLWRLETIQCAHVSTMETGDHLMCSHLHYGDWRPSNVLTSPYHLNSEIRDNKMISRLGFEI